MFVVMLRKELQEQWRSYRLLIVVLVFCFFGLLSPLTARYYVEFLRLMPEGERLIQVLPPPEFGEAIVQYVKNVGQFGLLLTLIMTMGAMVQERERGTSALILVKPISRSVFVFGKFAAIGITFALGILISALAAYGYTWLLFEPIDVGPWILLNGLALLVLLVYIALTLCISAASRSITMSGGLSLALLLLISLLSSLPGVGHYLSPALLGWGVEVVTHTAGADVPWGTIMVSFALIVAGIVGAWLVFRNQEV